MKTLDNIDLFAKPQRDEKGRFIKGNTMTPIDKVGNACQYCENKEAILKKIQLFSLWTRGKLPDGKLHMPYIEDLVDEDFLDVVYDTFLNWVDLKNDHSAAFHTELIQTYKKLFTRQRSMLLKRSLNQNAVGAIFQLKVNHGYVETEKRILAGDPDKPVNQKLEIEITEAKKHE